MKEIIVNKQGNLPCLHCGEIIDISGDIHVCNAPSREWLYKQDSAILMFPDGTVWDLKKKTIHNRDKK